MFIQSKQVPIAGTYTKSCTFTFTRMKRGLDIPIEVLAMIVITYDDSKSRCGCEPIHELYSIQLAVVKLNPTGSGQTLVVQVRQ